MTDSRLEAVLPLRVSDLARSAILRRSLELFFPQLSRCWVVTRDDDFDVVGGAFDGPRYRVIRETDLIPELNGERGKGWFVQQLVKLAIAERIGADFYLTLDADVICVRSVSAADLVIGNRAVVNVAGADVHPDWYRWAERVLGLARSGWTHEVTPAVLSREAVLRLQDYLSKRSTVGWHGYLLDNLPWTEYSLYYTFLEGTGLFDEYHIRTNSPRLYGNCIWNSSEIDDWDPERSFGQGGPLFSVLQSNSGVSAEQVLEKVEVFLR